MPGVKVHVRPLANEVMVFAKPPSPQQLRDNPDLVSYVWRPKSTQFAGVDSVMFMWVVDDAAPEGRGKLLAVGIQDKWSSLQASTTLSPQVVKKGYDDFITGMKEAGWSEDDMLFVVLAHRRGSGVRSQQAHVRNIAVMYREQLKEWLGPTLYQAVNDAHALVESHVPPDNLSQLQEDVDEEQE